MKKILVLAVAAVMLSVVAVGCSPAATTPSTGTKATIKM